MDEKTRKKLLNDFRKRRRYRKLKAEELEGKLWRSQIGRGYGIFV
jgi:hypothetical protein